MSEPLERPGHLDVGRAMVEGWGAVKLNAGRWFAVLALGYGLALISIPTVIGIFSLLPLLFWGAVVFTLRTIDQRAEIADLFDGFGRFPFSLASMLGFAVLYVLIALPGTLVVQMAAFSGSERAFLLLAIGHAIQILWTFGIAMRFYFAPYYIVDRRLGPLEALRASWVATSEQKLSVAALGLVTGLVAAAGALPSVAIATWGTAPLWVIASAAVIGMVPGIAVAASAWASGYRQIAGQRARGNASRAPIVS